MENVPEYDFTGEVAIVTGAARGIGRAVATGFARNGADVVATDICASVDSSLTDLGTNEDLQETVAAVEEHGGGALGLRMDVRDPAAVEAAIAEAVTEFGGIDILANNAAIWSRSDLVDMSDEQWGDLINTNLTGVFYCSKHAGRRMIDQGTGGTIISTSSTAGVRGEPGIAHYAAAKHGVHGLTKSLALELGRHGINVNAVCPTGVATPMTEAMVDEFGEDVFDRLQEIQGTWNVFGDETSVQPRDVAEAFLWLASDAARFVTGTELFVDAGFTAK